MNEYIENHLFDFETAVKGKSAGLGFVRTIYQQRIVSSFKACLDTLTSRLNRLQLNIDNDKAKDAVVKNKIYYIANKCTKIEFERLFRGS